MGYHMLEKCRDIEASPAQKAVLMALAFHHNDADGRCFPNVTTLMQFTCLSNRAVADALAALEVQGHLTAQRRNGTRSTYTLHPRPSSPGPEAPQAVNPAHGLAEKPVPAVHRPGPEAVYEAHGLPARPVNRAPKPVNPAHTNRRNRTEHPLHATPSPPSAGRHREIISRWGERFETTHGYKPVLDSRDARSLQKLLTQVPETSEQILDVAEQAWHRQRTDRYASACKKAVTLTGLCLNWTPIRAELQRPFEHGPSRAPLPARSLAKARGI